jgi:hypothetical protein
MEEVIQQTEGVSSERNTRIKFVMIVTVSFLMAGIMGTYLFLEIRKSEEQKQISSNPVPYIKDNLDAKAALQYFNDGNYQVAHENFETLVQKEKNEAVKESLMLYSAAALMESDREKAVQYYKDIYTNEEFLKENRAYALLKVLQYSMAENNLSYLYPFLDEKKSPEDLEKNAILLEINKKIYDLYPYSIAAVRLAKLELQKIESKDGAMGIWSKYKDSIEMGRQEMFEKEGLRHMAANTILNEAQLSRDLEKYGLSTSEETLKLFDLAYSTSKLFSPKPTQQFVLLFYAEYLVSMNDREKAFSLLAIINEEGPRSAIKINLSSPGAKDEYINLAKFATENKEAGSFFKQFGW